MPTGGISAEQNEKCSMRFRFLAVLTVSLSPTMVPVFAQQSLTTSPAPAPVYMETITLRYTDPAAIAKLLNASSLPEGTTMVKVEPKIKRSLRVVGTQDAISAVKEMIAIMDVAPRSVTMKVSLERVRFEANGKKITTTPIGTKTATVANNKPVNYSATDSSKSLCVVTVTPRLAQGGVKDTVFLRMGLRKADGATVGLDRATLLPAMKETKRLIGLTFADDSSVVSTVGTGGTPAKWKQPFTAYYASVQVLPAASAKKP